MIAARWFARLVLVASIVLLVQTVRLENASLGLASPIWGQCHDIVTLAKVRQSEHARGAPTPYPTVDRLAKSCSKLHSNLQQLFSVLTSSAVWHLAIGLLLCVASLAFLFSARTAPPPNNSSKPTPLRGGA